MSLLSSAWGIIKGAGHDVVDLGRRVWHAIDGVYTFIKTILFHVGDAWSDFHKAVNAVDRALDHWLGGGFDLFKFIFTKGLPGAADWAVRKAVGLAVASLRKVERWAATEINKAKDYALKEARRVETWAVREIRKVEARIAAPVRWIRNEGAKIAGLVLHPDRMAQWIVRALLGPLVKLILTGSGDVLVALIRGWGRHETEVAHTLEDVLSKFL